MGRIDVLLSEDLERRFKETVFRVKGMKRGNLKEAIEEAVEKWIAEHSRRALQNH